jgi:hypothetical protein
VCDKEGIPLVCGTISLVFVIKKFSDGCDPRPGWIFPANLQNFHYFGVRSIGFIQVKKG